jgi:hypothetical protein
MKDGPIAQALVVIAGGLIGLALALRLARGVGELGGAGRVLTVAVGVLAFGCWLDVAGEIAGSASRVWNAVRLTPAFALARGFAMYHGPDEGPVIANVYGPLLAIVYLPCTLFERPSHALRAGALLSVSWTAIPIGLALLRTARRAGAGWAAASVGAVGLYALALPWGPIRSTTFSIAADAPAVGLGMWACTALARGSGRESGRARLLAALAASLAVWTKQVMLPLLPALLAWTWWRSGRRSALRFAAVLAAVFLGVSVCFLAALDPAALWFSTVTVLASHPWIEALFWEVELPAGSPPWLGSAKVLAEALLLTLLQLAPALAGIGVLVWLRRRPAAIRDAAGSTASAGREWTLWLTAGLFLIPASVLGRVKVGGDINAYGYSMYFCFAAAALCGLGAWPTLAAHLRGPGPGRAARRIACFALLGLALWRCHAGVTSWRWGAAAPCPTEAAWAWAREEPGRIYDPSNPLVGLMAEGRLYHFDYSLYERRLAGHPLGEEHVRAFLPASMRYVVLEMRLLELQRHLPPLRSVPSLRRPGLERVFEVQRPRARPGTGPR